MIKHKSVISGVATFKDRYVATAGYDNQVILWDAKTNQALACGFHDHLANQCQFSPDGKYLVSSSSDYSARLWSVPEMKLLTILNGHNDDVEGVAFHPSQEIIATTSRDHHIRIYTLKGDLLQTLTGHTQDVLSVVWIDDKKIISCSDDGTVKLWQAFDGTVINDINLDGVETDTIALNDKGEIFAGNDLGEIIKIDQDNTQKIKAHQAGIKCLCYNYHVNKLISLSYDRTMGLWGFKNGQLILEKMTKLPNIVWARSADFLGDDKVVLATFGDRYASYDYVHDQWQTENIQTTQGCNAVLNIKDDTYSIGDSGILYKNETLVNHIPSLCNFLLSVDNMIITGGQTGEVLDAVSGRSFYQHHSPLNCGAVYYQDDIAHVIIGTYTGEGLVFRYHQNTFTFIKEIALHDNAIKGISASEKVIFSVCATGAAAFHAINNYRLLKYIDGAHDKIANGCAELEDNHFVSVSRDLTLRITSLYQQDIIPSPHQFSIKCVAVSADKRFIATGGYHGMLWVYDMKESSWFGQRISYSGISSLTFDLQTNAFLISSYDGNIYSYFLNELSLSEAA